MHEEKLPPVESMLEWFPQQQTIPDVIDVLYVQKGLRLRSPFLLEQVAGNDTFLGEPFPCQRATHAP